MKKQTILRIISIIFVLAWMITVFMLSHQIAEESSKTSSNFITVIIKLFNKDIEQEQLETMILKVEMIVRKLAHFVLYTLGGMLITIMFINFKEYITKTKIASFLLGATYAITDEIHQLFIPGRSGEIRDVLIDSTGVLLGVFIIYLLMRIKGMFRSGEKNK
ncbi:MAG: VanZ family protein [Clostridia bacterium]|nr:VanZ family protein [Clostridia bacterium]